MRFAAIVGLIAFALASVDADDSLGKSLINAVVDGNVTQTRQLVEQWHATGKPFPLGPDDKPLLFLAIEGREKSHPEIVELLLASGADVQTKGPTGMTALHWAASHGYGERTTQMLQHHAQVEATDNFGRTPLLVAHADAAEKLLAAHANWMALDKQGNNSLHYAAEDSPHHLELLFRAGFNVVDARNNSGLTPLHFATLAGNTESARWLLGHGANPNAVTAASYKYLPLDFYPGYGNETHVPAGISVAGIASIRHEETKWSSGRYRAVKEMLSEHGATAPRRLSPVLTVFFGLMMAGFFLAFIIAIFFVDARLTGWRALAHRFPGSSEPVNVNRRQNGGVGLIDWTCAIAQSATRRRHGAGIVSRLPENSQRRTSAAAHSLVATPNHRRQNHFQNSRSHAPGGRSENSTRDVARWYCP